MTKESSKNPTLETQTEVNGGENKQEVKPTPDETKEKVSLKPDEIKNLEKIGKENDLTSHEVRGIYTKYGEGKPIVEITKSDFEKAKANQKFQDHNKLAYELNTFNKLSPAKRNAKGAEAQRNRITALVTKLGYESKSESDGKITVISDTGKSVRVIGVKEEIPKQTQQSINFAKRIIEQGNVLTDGAQLGDLKPSEIKQGIKDINDGRVNSQPAKRLMIELDNLKKHGGIEYMQGGSGGKQSRDFAFVPFDKLGFELEHPEDTTPTKEQNEADAKEFDEYVNNLENKESFENFIDDNYESEKSNNGTESKVDESNKKSSIREERQNCRCRKTVKRYTSQIEGRNGYE